MLAVLNVLLGGALLAWGRRLFWLFVGAGGFLVGVLVASRLTNGPEWLSILVGLACGILFALLAVFFEGVAIIAGGFLGGGYILLALAAALGLDRGIVAWIVFLVGGFIGALVVGALFDWAVISISCLVGASVIVSALHWQRAADGLIFLILVFVGVVFQSRELRHAPPRDTRRQAPD